MSACPLVDCHTHTSFSDGHASFEDNVRAAAAAGCRVMVSTDHLTLPASMDSNCEVQVVEGDLPAHRLAFGRRPQACRADRAGARAYLWL